MHLQQGAGAGLDSEALIRIAAESEYTVSLRMLETFRAHGLLPRPARTGHRGRTPVWTYPDGADQQLVSLLGWREHTKDTNSLRVLLWLDGFPISPGTIRDALTNSLQAALDMIEQEIATQAQQHGLDPHEDADRHQALNLLAGTLAAKRGPKALPRHSRVGAADRTQAVHLILRAFALGQRVDATTEEAKTVERVLGVAPNGRRQRVLDAEPWLTGPADELFDAAEVVALPTALQAVNDATDVELETARHIVVALFRHLPLVARMMAALFDEKNHAGMAGLRQIDQNPEIVVLMVPWVIGMLRAGWHENLQAITTALAPMPELAAQTQDLLDQPAKTIAANLNGQPPEVQQFAQRIIDAAIHGTLDQPHQQPPTH